MNKLRFLVILFVLTMGCGGIFVKKPIIIATTEVKEKVSTVQTTTNYFQQLPMPIFEIPEVLDTLTVK